EQRRQLRGARRPGPLPGQERRPQRGASMTERRCPKCGGVYPDTARFCSRDGTMLIEVQSPKPPPPPSARRTPPPPHPPPGPPPDRGAPLSSPIIDARHPVLKELGAGGRSSVPLAREPSSGRAVAIQV